jgi:hypothetical protein
MHLSTQSVARILMLAFVLALLPVMAGDASSETIPINSKVFVQPGEFGNFIVAAIQKKKVPLVLVADETAADYIITGTSESQKSGWARTIFLAQTGSNEEASISVVRKADKVIIWAYNVHKRNSVRGKQSSGEACAKHLKKIVR